MNKQQKKLTVWFVIAVAIWIVLLEISPFIEMTSGTSPARDEFVSSIKAYSK